MGRLNPSRLVGVVLAAAAVVASVFVALPAVAATTGDVYVVNGLSGETVDILVDGNNVAPSAAPKTIVGPLHLTPGDHVVTFRRGTDTVVNAKFGVEAGSSSDVVAHRTADSSRQPVVTVFVNDVSPVRAGMTRVVVSHVATAPAADIRIDGEPLFRNVASGESLTLDLDGGKQCTIDVVPTLTDGPPILDMFTTTFEVGTLTRIFVIGDAGTSADAILQVLPVGSVAAQVPTKVATGDGGQAADMILGAGRSDPASILAMIAASALAVLMLLRRGRRAVLEVGHRHAR